MTAAPQPWVSARVACTACRILASRIPCFFRFTVCLDSRRELEFRAPLCSDFSPSLEQSVIVRRQAHQRLRVSARLSQALDGAVEFE